MNAKRILCTVLTVILLFTATGLSALASDAVITANTRVYQRASTSSKSIKVKKGMNVDLIATKGSWALVENAGIRAYIKAKYVEAEPDYDALMENAKPATITANTRVYQRASTSSKSIKVKKGMNVDLLTTKNGWALVENGGIFAYVKSKYISTKAQSAPAASTGSAFYKAIMKEARPAIITARAPIYQDANREGRSITINKGLKVNLIASKEGTSMIENNGAIAYINQAYVSTLALDGSVEEYQNDYSAFLPRSTEHTLVADAKLRTFNNPNSSYINLDKGSKVRLLSIASDGSLFIAKMGMFGYLYGYVPQDAINM